MKTRPKSKHGKSGAWNKEQKRRFDHIEGKKSQSYWKLGQNEAGSQVPRLDGRLLDDDCFGRSSLEGGNGISQSKNPGDPLGRVREDSLSQCVAAGASYARDVMEEDDYRPGKKGRRHFPDLKIWDEISRAVISRFDIFFWTIRQLFWPMDWKGPSYGLLTLSPDQKIVLVFLPARNWMSTVPMLHGQKIKDKPRWFTRSVCLGKHDTRRERKAIRFPRSISHNIEEKKSVLARVCIWRFEFAIYGLLSFRRGEWSI